MGSSPTAPAKLWIAVFGPHVHKITQKILKKCLHRFKRCVNISEYQLHDSVAQLDRAFDYESKGQGFESLLGHQIKTHKLRFVSFLSLFIEYLVMIVCIKSIKNKLKKSLKKRLTI